jgi:hypothetical protein
MMNGINKTRFVTLMAAAAGVTASLGSFANPEQALARTPASALVADTVPAKKAAAAKKTGTAAKAVKAKTAAPAKATDKAKTAATAKKPVVNTATANNAPQNDACEGLSEADCRNLNGAGY